VTVIAIAFTVVAIAAALGGRGRYPLLIFHALGMGAIMLSVLAVPDFPHVVAASLSVALMLVLAAGVLGARIRRSAPAGRGHRSAVAVALFDVGFMSVATILMPVHSGVFAAVEFGSSVDAVGAHALMGGGGAMMWLVLMTWAGCAAVLTVPAIRRRSPEAALHLVCSACMIAAMAAMAV
jgi:hypothetical protein